MKLEFPCDETKELQKYQKELETLLLDYGHTIYTGARERIEKLIGKTYYQICDEAENKVTT